MPAARRRVVAALLVAVALLAGAGGGCAKDRPALPEVARLDAFDLSGRDGMIRLHLPPAGTPEPYPLVVALHSLFHDGAHAQRVFGLDAVADRAGFAVVYPDGLGDSWNAGSCCGYASTHGVDDVGYLRVLISHVERGLPIDRRRVVLVGDSNGGMLAYRYACEHAEEIAGIGVLSASLMVSDCRPSVPLAVVAVHGLRDRTVPPAGARYSRFLQAPVPSLSASLAPFRRAAGCPAPASALGAPAVAQPAEPQDPAQVPAAGPPGATRPVEPALAETLCGSGVRVAEWRLPAGGHGWPGADAAFDPAGVVWEALAPARSAEPGPNL